MARPVAGSVHVAIRAAVKPAGITVAADITCPHAIHRLFRRIEAGNNFAELHPRDRRKIMSSDKIPPPSRVEECGER